jgi:transcriptional regulator with GAF, ATPase, and Fis domain
MPVSGFGLEAERVPPDAITARSGYPASLRAIREAAERRAIVVTLEREGSCVATARALDIGLRTLFYKMRRLGIHTIHEMHAVARDDGR